MAAQVTDEVRARVQRFVTAHFTAEQDRDGDFTITRGSSRCTVFVVGRDDSDLVVVVVSATIARAVPETPELLQHVARSSDAGVFAHLALMPAQAPGAVTLSVDHHLLGNYLDEEELVTAVTAVLAAAEEIGPRLRARFGGTAPA